MDDSLSLLIAAQHSDSFSPGGMTAVSSGLESLANDHVLTTAEDVKEFVLGQLKFRWNSFDRPALIAAGHAANNLPKLSEIDRLVEALYLCTEARNGSSLTGSALLGVHVKLKTVNAVEYQAMVYQDVAIGHNCIVQGLVWKQAGLSDLSMQVVSAHNFRMGLVGSALRLGLIGHISAQEIISESHPIVSNLLVDQPRDLDSICAFTPQQEISMMRHESMTERLFVN